MKQPRFYSSMIETNKLNQKQRVNDLFEPGRYDGLGQEYARNYDVQARESAYFFPRRQPTLIRASSLVLLHCSEIWNNFSLSFSIRLLLERMRIRYKSVPLFESLLVSGQISTRKRLRRLLSLAQSQSRGIVRPLLLFLFLHEQIFPRTCLPLRGSLVARPAE